MHVSVLPLVKACIGECNFGGQPSEGSLSLKPESGRAYAHITALYHNDISVEGSCDSFLTITGVLVL